MRILHAHHIYRPFGGGEQYLLDVTKALEERGHTVSVISSPHGDNYHEKGRREYFIEGSFGVRTGMRMWGAVKEIIDREDPDVIHLHETLGFLSPLIVGRLLKERPVVQTLHTAFFFARGARRCCPTEASAAAPWASPASAGV